MLSALALCCSSVGVLDEDSCLIPPQDGTQESWRTKVTPAKDLGEKGGKNDLY